jgi:hypothetical protein
MITTTTVPMEITVISGSPIMQFSNIFSRDKKIAFFIRITIQEFRLQKNRGVDAMMILNKHTAPVLNDP